VCQRAPDLLRCHDPDGSIQPVLSFLAAPLPSGLGLSEAQVRQLVARCARREDCDQRTSCLAVKGRIMERVQQCQSVAFEGKLRVARASHLIHKLPPGRRSPTLLLQGPTELHERAEGLLSLGFMPDAVSGRGWGGGGGMVRVGWQLAWEQQLGWSLVVGSSTCWFLVQCASAYPTPTPSH